jgi:hypothetical protein
MTTPATQADTMDRALEAICMLLMPFFLLGAADDPEKARRAVANLIQAYNPNTTQELDLAARVIGFSAAALDNLCASMSSPTLSDTKVLRYRSAAVSLSRAAEQCRVVLQKLQTEPPVAIPAPRPRDEKPAVTPQHQAAMPQAPAAQITAEQIEQAKSDARALLADLAKAGMRQAPGQGLTAVQLLPDPGAEISMAVTAAIAAHRVFPAWQYPTRA